MFFLSYMIDVALLKALKSWDEYDFITLDHIWFR